MTRFLFVMAICASMALAAETNFEELWQRAIVTVEVTRKQYDFLQPWSRRVDQVGEHLRRVAQLREVAREVKTLSHRTSLRRSRVLRASNKPVSSPPVAIAVTSRARS